MKRKDKLLTTAEAAKYLKITVGALNNLRGKKKGPDAEKIGKNCFYSKADLDAWKANRKRKNQKVSKGVIIERAALKDPYKKFSKNFRVVTNLPTAGVSHLASKPKDIDYVDHKFEGLTKKINNARDSFFNKKNNEVFEEILTHLRILSYEIVHLKNKK